MKVDKSVFVIVVVAAFGVTVVAGVLVTTNGSVYVTVLMYDVVRIEVFGEGETNCV